MLYPLFCFQIKREIKTARIEERCASVQQGGEGPAERLVLERGSDIYLRCGLLFNGIKRENRFAPFHEDPPAIFGTFSDNPLCQLGIS